MDIRPLTDDVAASPQISPSDVAALSAADYRLIVNNRPDGEAPGQSAAAEIAAAAEAEGLAFLSIPIGPAPMTMGDVETLAAALESAGGKTLLYCRSGTRSTTLWAFAEAVRGREVGDIIARAADAGYDLAPQRAALEQIARR
ncbi:MAG: TIGR01244 family sulfur transferase [Pacificimonas sp.]|jgi:uncharacterized protein (TIGR01244 family)|nr:TIGR01244 family sulfur transferase [Pacificimonas sp.]